MSKRITRSDEKESIFGLKSKWTCIFYFSNLLIVLSITFTLIYSDQAEVIF